VRQAPTGGSEWQTVVLAEALADRGYRVAVLTPDGAHARAFGVDYIPATSVAGAFQDPFTGEQRPSVRLTTTALVSERFGPLPPFVEFAGEPRVVFDLHDLPDPRIEHIMGALSMPGASIVVHSEFTQRLLPGWPRVKVIPCMLPDEFYDARSATPEMRSPRYVYGSAAMKGLEPTIALWRELKRAREKHFRKAELIVTSPGYDAIDPKLIEGVKDVRVVTGLSPAGMQQLLAGSDGIFMASTYPETFGIVFAQCEAAGKPARVLQLHGQEDALVTTLNHATVRGDVAAFVQSFDVRLDVTPRDFRVSTHIDSWIDALGLDRPQPKERAA
jgi:hypothetical protein